MAKIPMPHPFIKANLQGGFLKNNYILFIILIFIYLIRIILIKYGFISNEWISEFFLWFIGLTWFIEIYQVIYGIGFKFSILTGWLKYLHHMLYETCCHFPGNFHLLSGKEYDDKPQHKCIDPKKEQVRFMLGHSDGDLNNLRNLSLHLKSICPLFNFDWFIPNISYNNCETRTQYLWIKHSNCLVKWLHEEYNGLLSEYIVDYKAYIANSGDPDICEKYFSNVSKMKWIITKLEMLNILRNNPIVPDGPDLTSHDWNVIDDISTIMENDLSLEFINDDSYIIRCAYSDRNIDKMDIKPNPEEIKQLTQTNSELDRKQLRDRLKESTSNVVKLVETNPESSNMVRSSPRSRRVADLSYRSPRIRGIRTPNTFVARPSPLSIEWKPNNNGKRSYSTGLKHGYDKSVVSNLLPYTSAQKDMKWKLNKKITGDYIAGFVQADGSFSAVLTSKIRNSKRYLNISLVFTIVQHEKYKDLILEIQKHFGGIGNWYFNKKDKTIRYQVTKQSDLLNVIIPFFMKHQLRSGKLLSFLYFKYIATVMSTRAHWNNQKMLLSLIVLASHLNPLGKLGNKIRYLTPEEQKYVINNIQPEGIDISELTESIQKFKQNELTLEFIHGLFDGDGNISIYFVKPSEAKGLNRVSSETEPLEEIKAQHENQNNEVKQIKLYVGYSFTIVQNKHNLSLLNEIKSFFNETGGIYEINANCSIYKTESKSILASIILPKMVDKESLDWVDSQEENINIDLTCFELNLPLLKYNKIYYSCKILKLLSNGNKLNNEKMYKFLELSYYVRNESDNLTLRKYIENFKQKWLL